MDLEIVLRYLTINMFQIELVCSLPTPFFFKVYSFILRERGRVCKQGRGRERERITNRLCTVSLEPDAGLDLLNCEIVI